jgi:hypothetical protein
MRLLDVLALARNLGEVRVQAQPARLRQGFHAQERRLCHGRWGKN